MGVREYLAKQTITIMHNSGEPFTATIRSSLMNKVTKGVSREAEGEKKVLVQIDVPSNFSGVIHGLTHQQSSLLLPMKDK